MRTIFYLNGNTVTRKALNELLGAPVVRELVRRAKETHFLDPMIQNDFYMGSYGVVTVCFV